MMKLPVQEMRRVGFDLPSELDVARAWSNWASVAQEFYSAAAVLYDARSETHARMHSGEPLTMTPRVIARIRLERPIFFSMAMAIELAIKAATVGRDSSRIVANTRMFFASHKLLILCRKISELCLSDAERKCVQEAEEIVRDGKYPVGLKPTDDESASLLPDLDTFLCTAIDVYRKLMRVASSRTNGGG